MRSRIPYVPQRDKVVIVTVVERPRQYAEVAPGFSTGEGFRLATEYGHRNLWGNAVQLTLRLQLAYIPTPFIIDPTARANYRELELITRLGMRATGGIVVPEIGLGPLVRAGIDNILVHDLQRDFFITKLAAVPSVNWRPVSEFQITLFQSFEFNNSRIFWAPESINDYIASLEDPGLQRDGPGAPASRVPGVRERGLRAACARGAGTAATTRSMPRRARISSVEYEHVDGYPLGVARRQRPGPRTESHFFTFTETFGGYVCLTHCRRPEDTSKGSLRFAALTRLGVNAQLTRASATYPDRLFFMGGVDSMRGWNIAAASFRRTTSTRSSGRETSPTTVEDPANPGNVHPEPGEVHREHQAHPWR